VGVARKKTLLLNTYTSELPFGDHVAYSSGSGGGGEPGRPVKKSGGGPGGPPSPKLGGASFFRMLGDGCSFVRVPDLGANDMILKIFSPKILPKIVAFFSQTTASFYT
jgi:hypothetical protein